MFRFIFIVLFIAAFGIMNGQTKGAPANKNAAKKAQTAVADSASETPADTLDEADLRIKADKQFAVYTKRPKGGKDRRPKLCINLVSPDTTLNHCINDTTCRNPEVFKKLFEKRMAIPLMCWFSQMPLLRFPIWWNVLLEKKPNFFSCDGTPKQTKPSGKHVPSLPVLKALPT